MKTKIKVFSDISSFYITYIDIFYDLRSLEYYYLGAYDDAPEEYCLIANAANKFYGLVTINDSKKK